MIVSARIVEWFNREVNDRYYMLTVSNFSDSKQHLINIRGSGKVMEHVMSVDMNNGQKIIDHCKMQEEQLELAGYESIYSNQIEHEDISKGVGTDKMLDIIRIGSTDAEVALDIMKIIQNQPKAESTYANFGAWS